MSMRAGEHCVSLYLHGDCEGLTVLTVGVEYVRYVVLSESFILDNRRSPTCRIPDAGDSTGRRVARCLLSYDFDMADG